MEKPKKRLILKKPKKVVMETSKWAVGTGGWTCITVARFDLARVLRMLATQFHRTTVVSLDTGKWWTINLDKRGFDYARY